MRVAVYANGIRRALAKGGVLCTVSTVFSPGNTAGAGRPGRQLQSRRNSATPRLCLLPVDWFRLSVVVVSLRDARVLLITVPPDQGMPESRAAIGRCSRTKLAEEGFPRRGCSL
jgi:hypothetical protein